MGGLTLAIRLGRAPFGKEYAGIRNFIEFVVKFWYGCERIGPCTVPRSGPVIITTNHECAIDPFLILGTCNYRLISFMIAAEYNRNPIIKHITRSGRNIPVRRGENDISATKTAIRRLRNKGTVGIFIQGGIRSREREDQLKNGVAILALRTGATVIPAHINYLTGPDPREGMLWSFLKRRDTRITYGKAVDLSEFAGGKGQRNLEGASRRIFAAINDLAPK